MDSREPAETTTLMINLFWDFDGTLARRDGLWTATLHAVLADAGYDVPFASLRPFLNLGFPWDSAETPHEIFFGGRTWWGRMNEYFAEIFSRFGVPESEAGRLAEAVRGEYLRPDKWSLFPDAVPALAAGRARGHAHVILSNHVPELPDIVRALGLEPLVAAVGCSARLGAEKPSRRIYDDARHLAPLPGPCVMIGDNYVADVAGAVRAGMPAVLVRGSNPKSYPYFSEDLVGAIAMAERLAMAPDPLRLKPAACLP